ncbi:MAG TPA: carboxyl transferase domain-containing protein [Myxococcota bacterium]|nr:carboxyl transferase domain-containing protein [Myxococcota bacterium]
MSADDEVPSDWKPLLDELASRKRIAQGMGGPERLERLMYARGKLDARQRIARLFDPDSFVEIGALTGGRDIPADALVAGMGRIDGRPVLAGAEDFSVMGGSIGMGSMAKRTRLCELALRERVPLVMMLEGAGHRLTSTLEGGVGRTPNDLLLLADLRGHVPMVCLVLGASAGHGALTAPLSDFVVMTESAALFTGGPPLVKAATGEDVTKEELGGPKVCAEIAGTAHEVAKDDASAIALARRYLGYFPQSAGDAPPRREGPETGPRRLDDILALIPPNDRRPYSMHAVLERLVDSGSLLEIAPRYGRSLVTALAFLGGHAIGIVANNPAVRAGAVDSPAAIKAAEFLESAGAFGLPVVFLADNPGVMAGTKAERDGILKWAGRMFVAQRRLRGPKLHVTVRKSFGFGASTMGQNPYDRQTLSLVFPGVTMDAMPAASGGRSARLDDATQARVEERQRAGPWRMAAGMTYDEVIDPRELRNALIAGLELSAGRVASRHAARED